MDTTNKHEDPELLQITALRAQLMAETARISREPLWHPIAIALGLIGAGTAIGVAWVLIARMLVD